MLGAPEAGRTAADRTGGRTVRAAAVPAEAADPAERSPDRAGLADRTAAGLDPAVRRRADPAGRAAAGPAVRTQGAARTRADPADRTVADRTGVDLTAHMSWHQCRDEQVFCRGPLKVLPCHVNPSPSRGSV